MMGSSILFSLSVSGIFSAGLADLSDTVVLRVSPPEPVVRTDAVEPAVELAELSVLVGDSAAGPALAAPADADPAAPASAFSGGSGGNGAPGSFAGGSGFPESPSADPSCMRAHTRAHARTHTQAISLRHPAASAPLPQPPPPYLLLLRQRKLARQHRHGSSPARGPRAAARDHANGARTAARTPNNAAVACLFTLR